MSNPDTPLNGGIGISQAQDAISTLLAADEGDNQAPEDADALPPEGDEPEGDEPESDVDDGEAPDDLTDDGESEPDDEDGQDEPENQPIEDLEVEVDGQKVKVDELKKGYLRQSDYTRKTQQVAEARKALETELESIRVERSQYEQLLPALQQQLHQLANQEPDWDALYQQDPFTAVQEERKWRVAMQQRQEQLEAIQAEQSRLASLRQSEQLKQLEHHLSQERDLLLERIPAWKDTKVAAAERKKVKEYAQSIGFSAEELEAVTDHRAVIGLYKAMKYDEMMAKRAQAQPRQTVPVARPGTPAAGKKTSDVTREKQRLAKTGRVQDAAKLIERLI